MAKLEILCKILIEMHLIMVFLWIQVRHLLSDRKKLRRVIDPDMSKSSYSMESVAMFADLASRCVRIEGSARPSMAECVKELQLIIRASMRV